MNLGRDFDIFMYGRSDIVGFENRLPLTDWTFLEALPHRRPFLAKMRQGLYTLTQIRKIRIHITLEMREPVLK